MQVSVESTSELSRTVTVRVPEEQIREKMEARFSTLTRKVKLDGFRPGKVPAHVVKKMFAGQVRNEVIGDLIESSFVEALREHGLQPASTPSITKQSEEGQGLEYTASFEVYPRITINPPEQLHIKRPVAEVTDGDLEAMIERLREQRKVWEDVERESRDGDRVTINFSGSVEGENFTDGTMEDYPVIIGSNSMIPGFEDRLIGIKPGESVTFTVEFPADYGNEKLAGKVAEFQVDVTKVESAKLPEVDAEFIKEFGIENGDLEEFRADVRNNMERELHRVLRDRLKTAVMDALYAANPITVPNALLDQEIDRFMEPYIKSAKERGLDVREAVKREDFEEAAKRRVALGLILSEIVQSNNIKSSRDGVRSALEEIAKNYDNPQAVIDWYHSNSEQLANVEHMVLEDQIVEWVTTRAKLTDEPVAFSDLMFPEKN